MIWMGHALEPRQHRGRVAGVAGVACSRQPGHAPPKRKATFRLA